MKQETELKLITKEDFEKLRFKYKNIEPEADEIIKNANDPLDVLALLVQEGSGFTILKATILNEDKEEECLQIFREGTI